MTIHKCIGRQEDNVMLMLHSASLDNNLAYIALGRTQRGWDGLHLPSNFDMGSIKMDPLCVQAVQELALRSSRRWRSYVFYRYVLRLDHATASIRVLDAFARAHEADAIASEMVTELLLIPWVPVIYIAFERHKLLLSIGYSATKRLDVALVLFGTVLQFSAELLVDLSCMTIESRHGLLPFLVCPTWLA